LVSKRTDSEYQRWNDALAARFFNDDNAGQPVYLFVSPDLIVEAGDSFGQGLDDYLAAVREGPPGLSHLGHCQRALQLANGWRDRGLPYPPYIAYLALFVLAAGHEGDFDPRSYYPRLWELLDELETGTPPSFDRMLELWDDLERWSVNDRQGELGLFEATIVGGKIHIGLPLAQTVLTEGERRSLPAIFAAAGLDVGSLPSDRELLRALTVHSRHRLRRQTMRALERGSVAIRDVLLEIVLDDFLDWDGELPEAADGEGPTSAVSASLRLCLLIDRISGKGSATLRCRSKKDLPVDGLLLSSAEYGEPLSCRDFIPGWSLPLVDEAGAPIAPTARAWLEGLALIDSRVGWTVRLRPAAVRLFVEGRAEQLPGLVEVLELPRNSPFYIAFSDTARPAIEPWIAASCEAWQPIAFESLLPGGWQFGSVARATDDAGLRALDGAIGFPDRPALRLVGGIRSKEGGGNTFFAFSPPRVALAGAMPGDTVLCDGQELAGNASDPWSYELPSGLPLDVRVGLEVRHGEEVLKRRSLYLISGSTWRLDRPIVVTDAFGRVRSEIDGIDVIVGADVHHPTDSPFHRDLLRTPGLDGRATRVYFIGRSPGEIVTWPAESLPESWEPVWAVPLRRRGRALYCGQSLDEAGPLEDSRGTPLRLELWRQVIWQWRARILPPAEPPLNALWKEYVRVAHG
jgi:hypothetical protein